MALLDDLRDLTEELGRSPTRDELREHGSYSYYQFWQRFGGLKVADVADGRYEPD